MRLLRVLTFLVLLASPAPASTTVATEPVIQKIRGRIVHVTVPAGFDQVTLQRLASPVKSGVHAGLPAGPNWKTVSTQFTKGQPASLVFRLPKLLPMRSLRVYGTKLSQLPANLLTGITSFLPDPPNFNTNAGGAVAQTGVFASDSSVASSPRAETAPRPVVESDIWKLAGDRLYFFNSSRGLQVFDLTSPDNPSLLGTLRLPGVGEEMYLLDQSHVVLLKNGGYFSWSDLPYFYGGMPNMFASVSNASGGAPLNSAGAAGIPSLTSTSSASLSIGTGVQTAGSYLFIFPGYLPAQNNEVIIADVSQGDPKILSRIPFLGDLRESRLVGSVLYIASDYYGPTATNATAFEWGSHVSSFDLTNPANPVARSSVHVSGYANTVAATDQFFFVSEWQSGGGNIVQILDISDPSGIIKLAGQAPVPGSVESKFDIQVLGQTLAIVSAANRVGAANQWVWSPYANVSTFSISDPTQPAALGSLDLAAQESLTAARFDGNRLYIVTTQQNWDPLSIVDLSDAANPKVLGTLDVPGFSTFIQPLGDRLVTTGLVNWQPVVSLYDVSNPSAPTQLDSVSLASKDGYSYSEATWDEKAFNVLPQNHLILLPVSGYNPEHGFATGVQLIDLFADHLAKRGVIQHPFYPRRATVVHDRIVSISSTELVTVNAENRDHPKVTGDVEISWPANRAFLVGDYLLQISDQSSWDGLAPQIILSSADAPDSAVGSLDLSPVPITGATVRNGILYVLQSQQTYIYPPVLAASTTVNAVAGASSIASRPTISDVAYLTTFDVSHLPDIKQLAQISPPATMADDYSSFQPLWVNDSTLIWVGSRYRTWWWPLRYSPAAVLNASAGSATSAAASLGSTNSLIASPIYWWPPYVSGQGKRLFAFDVSSPDAPKFASMLEIGGEQAWDVSQPFTADNLVYISHKDWGWNLTPNQTSTAPKGEAAKPDPSANRHFLQVIEYGNSSAPIIRDPMINIPGELRGISRGGELLYTVGRNQDLAADAASIFTPALQVSAFDGELAHFLDQLPLDSASQPFVLSGETVFLLHPSSTLVTSVTSLPAPAAPKSSLATWKINESGKCAMLDEIDLDHEEALSLFGALAVAHDHGSSVHLLDARDPSSLLDLGVQIFEGSGNATIENAAGDVFRGFWLPVGEFGVDAALLEPPGS